ncbi:Fc.00g095030.m01.CDS01 [Cosmosporella sp. VM-42]
MRYEDWDILLFPQDCKVPMKEFKVSCHVVHDAEFSHTHGSFGLPTVSCFVPSLAAGTPFQISMHSWTVPTISQVTQAYTKYPNNVKFEARLLVDGRLVASTSLDRKSGWPHVIAHSFDFSKNGDLESLKFPSFRRELLQQSYWSPADDLGRIKIVISEGFPRDSLSMPIERVKNIVAFSFQHAPLEILESSSIAWPNSFMWRRAPFTTSMPVPAYPSDDVESHAHSPRRRTSGIQDSSAGYPGPAIQGIMSNTSTGSGTKRPKQTSQPNMGGASVYSNPDPFGDSNAYFDWLDNMGTGVDDIDMTGQASTSALRKARKTDTDISMPDYVSSTQNGQMAFPLDGQFPLTNFQPEEESYIGHMKVPTNTPTTRSQRLCESTGVPYPVISHNGSIPTDLANCLTNSLLNQPMPLHMQARPSTTEVRSRKENRLHQPAVPSPSAFSSTSTPAQEQKELRRVSQQMYIPSGGSMPIGVSQQQNMSPKSFLSSELAQKTPSLRKLGVNLSNLAAQDTSSLDGAMGSASSSDKGTKRGRNFTPGSTTAIEEDDEPLRGSPRVRLTPFAEETPTRVVT